MRALGNARAGFSDARASDRIAVLASGMSERLPIMPGGPDGGEPDIRLPDRPIYTPPGGPPRTDRIPDEVYRAMGEANVMALAEAFYRRIGESEAAALFPKGEALIEASAKTGAMFVFLFGGPHLYQQRHGAPRMRMRHLPFRIGPKARSVWLRCLRETLREAPEKFAMPAEHVETVYAFFVSFSAWMVNSETDDF